MSPKARGFTFSMLARTLLVVGVVAIAIASVILGPGVVAGFLVGALLIGSFGATLFGIVFGRRAHRTKPVPYRTRAEAQSR